VSQREADIVLTMTSLFKAAPTSAVTMWTYERVLKILIDMEARPKKSEE
jgi:solute carrier family 25 thiamine pyrophosphate transporter 19